MWGDRRKSGGVSAALGGEDPSSQLQAAFDKFLADFGAKNAAPIGFHVQSMTAFSWKPEVDDVDIASEQKDRKILASLLVRTFKRSRESRQTMDLEFPPGTRRLKRSMPQWVLPG
jgi:hypothetical protein